MKVTTDQVIDLINGMIQSLDDRLESGLPEKEAYAARETQSYLLQFRHQIRDGAVL